MLCEKYCVSGFLGGVEGGKVWKGENMKNSSKCHSSCTGVYKLAVHSSVRKFVFVMPAPS